MLPCGIGIPLHGLLRAEHYLYTLSMKCCQANVYVPVLFEGRFRKGGGVVGAGGATVTHPPAGLPPTPRCVHVRTMRNTRIAH